MQHAGNSKLVKKLNQAAILRVLRERGPLSRTEIAGLVHLNPSTVSRIVSELLAEHLVFEERKGQSSAKGGRQPIFLQFNYKASLIVGLDLGGTSMVGALADLEGNILYRESVPSRYGQEGLEALMALVEGLLHAPRLPGQKVRAIGIGAPGVTRSQEGVVVWAPSLGWREMPLKKIVEERFGIPTFVENDVNLHALGEHWRGAGRGVRDLVCIFIGTGIGAGIIINDELYRGADEAAGEVGYIIPHEKYLGRSYGEFGCLESLAAGPGIVRSARQAIQRGIPTAILDLAAGDEGAITAELVFAAARQGDAVAQKIVDETVRYLSIAVANVASIINPRRIVLGGGIAKSDDLILEPIKRLIQGVVPAMPEIVPSQLGSDAGVLGAVSLALRSTEDLIWKAAHPRG
jgi:glucokinase-like ROK family protein